MSLAWLSVHTLHCQCTVVQMQSCFKRELIWIYSAIQLKRGYYLISLEPEMSASSTSREWIKFDCNNEHKKNLCKTKSYMPFDWSEICSVEGIAKCHRIVGWVKVFFFTECCVVYFFWVSSCSSVPSTPCGAPWGDWPHQLWAKPSTITMGLLGPGCLGVHMSVQRGLCGVPRRWGWAGLCERLLGSHRRQK